LKDANSQLTCVLFRSTPIAARDLLEDGRRLVLQGELTVYEPRGQYQLIVRQLELQGVGALQQAFERLKQKLQAEGLFEAARKRPLPDYPERIGLVTSPTGAAIRDVLHAIGRRNPSLKIIFVPCRVQGEGAAREIAEAIGRLNAWAAQSAAPVGRPALDAILVTRGGGSLEDLWAFNEEAVARAIHASAIPVVSAVGHEIDFTISDFVADVRAATPSAAAEILTQGFFAAREFVMGALPLLRVRVVRRLTADRDHFSWLVGRFARFSPRRRFQDRLQRLDDLREGLVTALRFHRRNLGSRWMAVRQRFVALRLRSSIASKEQRFGEVRRWLGEHLRQGMRERREQLKRTEARLHLLSPQQVLERGYSITTDLATGRVLRSVDAVTEGQVVRTRVAKGGFESVVRKPS
jgi:exodeoxyribonuclease VII large subunit